MTDYEKGRAAAARNHETGRFECFYVFNAPRYQTAEFKRGYLDHETDGRDTIPCPPPFPVDGCES